MTGLDLIIFAIVTVLFLFGAGLGLWLAKKWGLQTASNAPFGRKLVLAAIVTCALAITFWWQNGGLPRVPLSIYVSVLIWAIAMFVMLRRSNKVI